MTIREHIEHLNRTLRETNILLHPIDPGKHARYSVLLKDDELAGYIRAAQKNPRDVPMLNIGYDTLPLVSGIPEKVVTVGQLANYFMISDEDMFEIVSLCDFRPDPAKEPLKRLEAQRREWEAISDRIGSVKVRYREAREFECTLEEAARLRHIPFDVLYAEYLYRGEDLGKAQEAISDAEDAADARRKIGRVLAWPEPIDAAAAAAYRELAEEGFRARNGWWLGGMESETVTFEPGDERRYLAMFLSEPGGRRPLWEFCEEEIERIREGYRAVKEDRAMPAAEFRALLQMSAQGTLGNVRNTLLFRKLTE